MTSEDDRIRQALSPQQRTFGAHSALQQLRPTMHRARLRRRVATGAATLALIAGASTGVLAVAASQNSPTLRTLPGDGTDTSAPTTRTETSVESSVPPRVVDAERSSSTLTLDDRAEMADDAPTPGNAPAPRNTAVAAPAPASPPETMVPPDDSPTPAVPAPATPAVPPSTYPTYPSSSSSSTTTTAPGPVPAPVITQTMTSSCGDVVVSVENGTVRIVSISTRPGYVAQVSDDGPISIEVLLRGAGDSCELHAELTTGGLDIDVQNPVADR